METHTETSTVCQHLKAAKAKEQSLSYEEISSFLRYDPKSGKFFWLRNVSAQKRAGDEAGSLAKGYVRINFKGIRYRAHRLAWFFHYREWPSDEVDHIKCDKSDNSIAHLREATHSQNKAYSKLQTNNKSGVSGVHWDARNKRWKASAGKKHLGSFVSKEDAIAARLTFENSRYGSFAPHLARSLANGGAK